MRVIYDNQIFPNRILGGVAFYSAEFAKHISIQEGTEANIVARLCLHIALLPMLLIGFVVVA